MEPAWTEYRRLHDFCSNAIEEMQLVPVGDHILMPSANISQEPWRTVNAAYMYRMESAWTVHRRLDDVSSNVIEEMQLIQSKTRRRNPKMWIYMYMYYYY